MPKKLYEESNIQAIAAAIREKNGTQNTYTAAQMANAVLQLHGEPNLETLTATENGNYLPSANKDGFSEVEVMVPNSYTNSDEGKVVKNGALVAQTARATAIIENGTYDTTENDEVTVNVSGESPTLQEKTATQNGIVLPDSGYDGLSRVTVNVSGGGGGGNELLTELVSKTFIAFSQTSSADLDTYIAGFDTYDFDYTMMPSGRGVTPTKVQNLTLSDILGLLQSENNIILEYYTNTSDASAASSMFENLKQNLHAVSLGQISGAGVLTDSINNYSYIMISSRYNSSGYSAYDVSMIYKPLELDVWYGTGMKDRNSSYRAYVKFGENDSVIVKQSKNDSGSNGYAVIYGIP